MRRAPELSVLRDGYLLGRGVLGWRRTPEFSLFSLGQCRDGWLAWERGTGLTRTPGLRDGWPLGWEEGGTFTGWSLISGDLSLMLKRITRYNCIMFFNQTLYRMLALFSTISFRNYNFCFIWGIVAQFIHLFKLLYVSQTWFKDIH